MRLWPLPLLCLLAAPLALAQNDSTDDLPVGTGAPGEQESIETAPGFAYGGAVLLGTLVFALVLGYVSRRYWRDRPPRLP